MSSILHNEAMQSAAGQAEPAPSVVKPVHRWAAGGSPLRSKPDRS
jgi:hypothetical protein